MYKHYYLIYKNLVFKFYSINSRAIDIYKNNITVGNKQLDYYVTNGYYILVNNIPNYLKYNNIINNPFRNNLYGASIMRNKSKFAEFMNTHYKDYIPTTIYYNYDSKTYINSDIIYSKLIVKPNVSDGGFGISIIDNLDLNINYSNHLISEYLDFVYEYAGHFVVVNNIVVDKIYFCAKKSGKWCCGNLRNYVVLENLEVSDSIFLEILNRLNYNGFVCIDFTIINNQIKIFEINPRIGGSLLANKSYFYKFLESIYKSITKKIEK